MDYQIVDFITADYKYVIQRLRTHARRTQSLDWLLDQLEPIAGAFGTLREPGYRQDAGAVMLALLDFLAPLRNDPRYKRFAAEIQTRMRVYGLNPARCHYYPPVKPLDMRTIEAMRQKAMDFGDQGGA